MSNWVLKRHQIYLFFLVPILSFITWKVGTTLASSQIVIMLDDIIFGVAGASSLLLMSVWILKRPRIYPLFVASLVVLVAWRLGATLASSDILILRADIIFGVLVVISLLLFRVVARSDPEGKRLFALLLLSFGLKLAAFEFRFLFGLLADARPYHLAGRMIADQLAMGQLPPLSAFHQTAFVRLLAGFTIFVTGATLQGVSIIWAWIGLVGMLFFYKAFCRAFPNGDRRLYMLLILFYPTMLLWTSSLGKDALMVMFLGMSAYGAARLRERIDPVGLWWLLLGLGGALVIRPHIAMIFAIAFAVSALIRPVRAGMLTPVVWFIGLALLVGVSAGVVRLAFGYIGVEVSDESVSEFVGASRERTGAHGGSTFEPVNPRTPVGAAFAIPTILFRPFPWEAHNTFAGIAAIEGMGLLALVLYRRRSVTRAIVEVSRNSLVLLTIAYTALFIFAFSAAIGNFGIIARQRAQVLPFVFMLMAYGTRRTGQEVGESSTAPGNAKPPAHLSY